MIRGLFRRAARPPQTAPRRPCGCNPPVYCSEAERLLALVDRGRRIAGQWGTWADHNQALVEFAIHLDREPSEVSAMLRHPVGRVR